MSKEKAWEALEMFGVSEETLQVATGLNGYTLETLKDVLFIVSGLRSFEDVAA